MKTPFNFFTLLFLVLVNGAFSVTLRKDSLEDKADSLICLEIKGRIYTQNKAENNFYTVELIENNTVIKAALRKDRRAFRFNLEKDKYYAIRISKEGYAPKLISIHTAISDPKFSDGFYSFSFKTELYPEEEFKYLDKDAEDFPIAIVSFNKQKKAFDYNEKYTGNIKKCLYITASR